MFEYISIFITTSRPQNVMLLLSIRSLLRDLHSQNLFRSSKLILEIFLETLCNRRLLYFNTDNDISIDIGQRHRDVACFELD